MPECWGGRDMPTMVLDSTQQLVLWKKIKGCSDGCLVLFGSWVAVSMEGRPAGRAGCSQGQAQGGIAITGCCQLPDGPLNGPPSPAARRDSMGGAGFARTLLIARVQRKAPIRSLKKKSDLNPGAWRGGTLSGHGARGTSTGRRSRPPHQGRSQCTVGGHVRHGVLQPPPLIGPSGSSER